MASDIKQNLHHTFRKQYGYRFQQMSRLFMFKTVGGQQVARST